MATHDVYLPPEEELTVPEVNLSSPALRAGAFHLGKYCDNVNDVSRTYLMFWFLVTSSAKQTENCRNSCCASRSWMIQESVWLRAALSPLALWNSSVKWRSLATKSSLNIRIAWIRAAAIWITNSSLNHVFIKEIYNSGLSFSCRNTQGVYDKCMLDNLNLERPEYGYFCRVKVHHTDRPEPPKEKRIVYPDTPDALPADYPRPPAKYGSRFHWMH